MAPAPGKPTNVKIEGNVLKWSTTGNVRSVVYHTSSLTKEATVLAITENNEWPASVAGHYAVSTINVDNKESEVSLIVEKK